MFAGFLIAAAVYVTTAAYLKERWYLAWPGYVELANIGTLCIAPCFYLYSKSVLDSSFRPRWRLLAYFSLPLLLVPFAFYALSIPSELRAAAIERSQINLQRGAHSLSETVILIFFNLYHIGLLGAASWELWRGRRLLEEKREEGRTHPPPALLYFSIAALSIAVFSAFLDFSVWAASTEVFTSLAILLAIFAILWLSTEAHPFSTSMRERAFGFAMKVPPAEIELAPETTASLVEIVSEKECTAPKPDAVTNPKSTEVETPATAKSETEKTLQRGRRDSMKPEDIDRLARKLREQFEAKRVYLDPNLSLQKLAETLGTTRHKLSVVINERLGGTFYQVIAAHRVRAAAEELRNAKAAHRTIAEIALDSGFNSLSAFNAAFRNLFGVTPREFRDKGAISANPDSPHKFVETPRTAG